MSVSPQINTDNADAVRAFVSYAKEDESWALWVGQELRTLGFEIEVDKWSWRVGDNAFSRMNEALERADIIMAICSPFYFQESRYSTPGADFLPRQNGKRFIPVVVQDCSMPPLYQPLIRIDLSSLGEAEASALLKTTMFPYLLKGDTAPQTSGPPDTPARIPFPGTAKLRPSQAVLDAVHAAVTDSREMLISLTRADVERLYIDQAFSDAGQLARLYGWTAPEEVFKKATDLRKRVALELDRNRNPTQLRDLYLIIGRVLGVVSYATLDLGDSAGAAQIARASLACAERAGELDLMAWAHGTLALIARANNRSRESVQHAEAGMQFAVTGTRLARLYSNAAESYSRLGNAEKVHFYLRKSEDVIDDDPPDEDTPDGIFYFPQAKLYYYAGSSLLQLPGRQAARDAEVQSALAAELFHSGPDDVRSYNDELVAHVHIARARLQSGNFDGVLPALQPVLTAPPEYRTSWHRHFLTKLSMEVRSGQFKGSAIGEQIAEAITSYLQTGPAEPPM